MTDIYENLARHLDSLPTGYPRTESGVEMRILKRLFSREEAEIALLLTMMPEPAAGIAERSGVDANYYAQVDADACTACETCVARCQMDAIEVEDVARVDLDRCIGCGLCVTDCPTEAITLHQKAADEQYVPPKNIVETYMNIAHERGLI